MVSKMMCCSIIYTVLSSVSVFVLWFGYGDEDFDVFMVQLEQLQREEREKKKEEKKKLQDELNTLFKPVQTVSKGKAKKLTV